VTRVVVVEISPRPQVETIVVTVESPIGQDNQALEGQEAIVTDVVDGDTIDVSIDGTRHSHPTFAIRTSFLNSKKKPEPRVGAYGLTLNEKAVSTDAKVEKTISN